MSEEKEKIQEEVYQPENQMEESIEDKKDDSVESELEDSVADEEEVDPIEQLEQEKKELQDKYIRLYSEFENFRRRTAKEKQDLRLVASEDLMLDLLPILDDFERGLNAISKVESVQAANEGMVLIFNKLKGILEKKGLKSMESKEKEFDLELHEALTKFPAPNPEMKGKVIDEIEKGYTLHNKVIRHAKVVVAE